MMLLEVSTLISFTHARLYILIVAMLLILLVNIVLRRS